MSTSSLNSLPDDVFLEVIPYIPPASSICLALTCRRLYSLVLTAESKTKLKDIITSQTAAEGLSFWSTVSALAELMERLEGWFPKSYSMCQNIGDRYFRGVGKWGNYCSICDKGIDDAIDEDKEEVWYLTSSREYMVTMYAGALRHLRSLATFPN